VFNVAEGLDGYDREALVPRICEELEIPFSAAGSVTLVNNLDKAKTKDILEENNIATPKFQVFDKEEEQLMETMNFPLLVKPMLEGSSKGIFNENLVDNEAELKKIIKKTVDEYKQPVIVEEFLNGREFTVSVIGYNNPIILPIVEIKFDHLPEDVHPMDSYEAKWIYDSPEFIEKNKVDPIVCPALIDEVLEKKIEEIVLKTFKVLDCKDWSRIDVRLDKDGIPNILEVNALPGFMKDPKENSRLPKAAYAAGWSYDKLIGEVIKSAKGRLEL
jgi:D-alanine-D-alanine ligase